MKKEFQIDVPIESDTKYFATESEYHVYAKDTVEDAGPYNLRRALSGINFKMLSSVKEK